MPGDALRKVTSGQPLHIPASTYNLFVDAAMDYRKRALAQESEAALKDTKSGIIPVRNQTGSDLAQFAVVGLAGLIITPTDNEAEFRSRPAFDVWQPAPDCELAVLQVPLAAGAIGPAMVFGVTPVRLDVIEEEHGYAGPAAGVTGALATAESGPARILWKESGTGLRWGVVRFPQPVQDPYDITVFNSTPEDIPEGGAMAVAGADPTVPGLLYVVKPSLDSQLNILPLVGPSLPPGGQRRMRLCPVMRFRFEGTWANPGEFLGAAANSWGLQKTKFGFVALATQSTPAGSFVYAYFSGLAPVLRALYDEYMGSIWAQAVDHYGGGQGDQFSLAVIPGGGGP